ncbi:MAG: SDR family oxidoreductase [Bacteroidetes bacterium]|nr:MAG: SDR family oxidoreductase [Bacteroidota bacterium]
MKKTVLITGASSGIGKAAAQHFAAQGWNVAATMRSPEKETVLNKLPSVKLFALDVTDTASIDRAIADAKQAFGSLDVVINNAGYGADGVFEAMSDDVIQRQYDTNVFGLMRVTRAVIPVMRAQKGGVILQVASMGGRLAFPLFSIYHGTKWAVEGFSESLQFELAPFNIQVKVIEPGAIKTEFYGRSREFIGSNLPDYQDFLKKSTQVNEGAGDTGDTPETVAKTLFKAATDGSRKFRYAVGGQGPMLLRLRKMLPDSWWFAVVRSTYKL